MNAKKIQYRFYSLTFPSEFTIEQTLDFFDSVSTALSTGNVLKAGEHLVIETWFTGFGITHRIGAPWQRASYVMQQLTGFIPGLHYEDHERESIPSWTHAVEIGVSDNTRPFNLSRVEAQAQRQLRAAMAEVKGSDVLLVQWVVAPGKNIKGPSLSREVSSSHWAIGALLNGSGADRDEIAERRENAAFNQFRAVFRVAAYAETTPHAAELIKNVQRAYQVPETASVHFTERWYIPVAKRIEHINRGVGPGFPYEFINAKEVAGFSMWPIGSFMIPGMRRGKTRPFPPNEVVEKNRRVLGESTHPEYKNRRIAVGEEGTTRHTYAVGASGLGKTTLLTNSGQQDMEQGYGLIAFDGKGDLIKGLLNAVPRERIGDVIYMNFGDFEFPVGWNPLAGGDDATVGNLMKLFMHNQGQDIYLRQLLFHGFHTMKAIPGLTVVDLLTFLDPKTPFEEAWRDYIISQLPRNGKLYKYWKHSFLDKKPTVRAQMVQPVQNRLWELTNHHGIRNMLGQSESTINFDDILLNNKILLIDMPRNLNKAEMDLLSGLLFSAIWERVQVIEMDRPTYLYIDEVQRFLNLPIDLPDMLSTARSRKLGITAANQYLSQLPPELFAALTNASTKIAFKLEGPDARKMADLFGKSVTPEDFINLDKYEVLAKVATPGGSSDPLTIKTFAEFEGHGLSKEVIARSRENYARRADTVDAEIEARRVAPDKPKAAQPAIGDRLKSDRGGGMSGRDE